MPRKQSQGSARLDAAGVAHDVCNLLATIVIEAEVALTTLSSGLSPATEVQRIRDVAERAAGIARQLMLRSVPSDEPLQPVRPAALLEDISEILRASIGRQIKFQMDCSLKLPLINVNVQQIQRAVLNLVKNASEAIGDQNGVITISTSYVDSLSNHISSAVAPIPDTGFVLLRITDTGCGMTPAQIAQMFNPLYTTKPMGTGIGLAVVDWVVKAHHGAIEIDSAPGRGTTVRVFLPCRPERSDSRPPSPHVARPASTTSSVLIVDDVDTLRRPIALTLRREGLRVLEASSEASALAMLEAHAADIDVVLLDLYVDGTPSHAFFSRLQELRPGATVFLMSGHDEDEAARWIDPTRIAGFIRKPFRLADLLKLVRKAIP